MELIRIDRTSRYKIYITREVCIGRLDSLQRWLYCREHLKYVWNVHCVITNHRRDPYTTETTDNERFPICHGTNYFRFVLTFSFLFLHVINCFSFLLVYSMCYKSEEYIQLWTIFGNKLQSRCTGLTRRFGVRIFILFVTIEIVSYAWSQVTMKVSRYSFLISIASRLLQHVIPQTSNA